MSFGQLYLRPKTIFFNLQVQQEQVDSSSGGLINGVQSGLNSSMNTVKFVLVILMPRPQTFGVLILTSFAAICLGTAFFVSYAVKKSKTNVKPEVNSGFQA